MLSTGQDNSIAATSSDHQNLPLSAAKAELLLGPFKEDDADADDAAAAADEDDDDKREKDPPDLERASLNGWWKKQYFSKEPLLSLFSGHISAHPRICQESPFL